MKYIVNKSLDPFFNHAVEEYFLKHTAEEGFILWRNSPSILIGRNQNTLSEINMEYVRENHIKVVRRLSGGGTVFCDPGNINFTFIVDKTTENNTFEQFAQPVICALKDLGIEAKFSGRNDITINNQKVSGNAQYHYHNRLLHHGTLLYQGDINDLTKALNPNPLKYKNKGIKSVSSRVTNIAEYMNSELDVDSFINYLKLHIMKSNNIYTEYTLTKNDYHHINKIMNSRFKNPDWNFNASPKYSFHYETKYPFGLIEYNLNVKSGTITDLTIQGDFFGIKPINELVKQIINTAHHDLPLTLSNIKIADYITGLSKEQLIGDLLTTTNYHL